MLVRDTTHQGTPDRTLTAKARKRRSPRRRNELNQLVAGEKIADFECRGIRRVGTMGDIVSDAGTQVVANGARRRLLRIGGPHSVAPLCDGPLRLQDHGKDFSGTHEISQLAKNGRSRCTA